MFDVNGCGSSQVYKKHIYFLGGKKPLLCFSFLRSLTVLCSNDAFIFLTAFGLFSQTSEDEDLIDDVKTKVHFVPVGLLTFCTVTFLCANIQWC